MNITSIFSAGYLQPISSVNSSQAVNKLLEEERIREQEQLRAQQANQVDLAKREQDVLAQENELKARSGDAEVHTVYQYAIGEDGRRYITGASVTITGDPEDVTRVGGGITSREVRLEAVEDDESEPQVAIATGDNELDDTSAESGGGTGAGTGAGGKELSDSEQATVNQLKQAEMEVKAHEAAHKAVAGQFGGSISYTYTEGPDGKKYITGGEVPIQMREGSTPEETVRNMQQVQRAAQAPASPSGQDLKVAAQAAARAAQAQSEVNAERAKKLSGSDSSSDTESGSGSKQSKQVKQASQAKRAEQARKAERAQAEDLNAKSANETSKAVKSNEIHAEKTSASTNAIESIESNEGKSKNEPVTTKVAKGTPLLDQDKPEEIDPTKDGASAIIADIKEAEINASQLVRFTDQEQAQGIAA